MADRTLPTRPELAWQKMAQSPLNDTTQPVDSEEEGLRPKSNHGQIMILYKPVSLSQPDCTRQAGIKIIQKVANL